MSTTTSRRGTRSSPAGAIPCSSAPGLGVLEARGVFDAPDLADPRSGSKCGGIGVAEHRASVGLVVRPSACLRSSSAPWTLAASSGLRPLVHARDRAAAARARRRREGASASAEIGTGAASARRGSSPLCRRSAVLHGRARRGARRAAAASSATTRTCACSRATGATLAAAGGAVRPALLRRGQAAASQEDGELVAGMLAPGGIAVLDDLTPGRPGPDPVRDSGSATRSSPPRRCSSTTGERRHPRRAPVAAFSRRAAADSERMPDVGALARAWPVRADLAADPLLRR